ncbi:MAG: hypothetical protein ACRD2W_02680 [Acidimicrobiales bacterium]
MRFQRRRSTAPAGDGVGAPAELARPRREGTGRNLIGTDIAYAVDAIIAKAKETPPDPNAVNVLATYGMLPAEVERFPFEFIRAKVFDKLQTDADQKTLYKSAKTALSDLKNALDFGEDKEGEYQTIEEKLKNPKKSA